jgi:pimeloyl-ACP methyl ester carboxylesterase
LPLVGRIKGLDLELVDGIGHMLQFVEPDRVEAFIRRAAARAFSVS